MTAAPATVTLCGCGHAERMHERDTGAEHDRGECMQRTCGCSQFRPGEPNTATVSPLHPEPAPEPQPEPPPTGAYVCTEPGCTESFQRPQGLGSHRRYVHPGSAGKPAGAPAPKPTPSAPPTATTPPPATTPEPARPQSSTDRAPTHSASLHIDLGVAGWVEITATAVRGDKLAALLALVAHYLQSTEGNQP